MKMNICLYNVYIYTNILYVCYSIVRHIRHRIAFLTSRPFLINVLLYSWMHEPIRLIPRRSIYRPPCSYKSLYYMNISSLVFFVAPDSPKPEMRMHIHTHFHASIHRLVRIACGRTCMHVLPHFRHEETGATKKTTTSGGNHNFQAQPLHIGQRYL